MNLVCTTEFCAELCLMAWPISRRQRGCGAASLLWDLLHLHPPHCALASLNVVASFSSQFPYLDATVIFYIFVLDGNFLLHNVFMASVWNTEFSF